MVYFARSSPNGPKEATEVDGGGMATDTPHPTFALIGRYRLGIRGCIGADNG